MLEFKNLLAFAKDSVSCMAYYYRDMWIAPLDKANSPFDLVMGEAIINFSLYNREWLHIVAEEVVPHVEENPEKFFEFGYELADLLIENEPFLELLAICSFITYLAHVFFILGKKEFIHKSYLMIAILFLKLRNKFEKNGGWKGFKKLCFEYSKMVNYEQMIQRKNLPQKSPSSSEVYGELNTYANGSVLNRSKSFDSLQRSTVTISKPTGFASVSTEAISKLSGMIPKSIGVKIKLTVISPKSSGAVRKSTGTLLKGAAKPPKSTAPLRKSTGAISETSGAVSKSTNTSQKPTRVSHKSTGATPKSTGAIPKSTGAIPKSTGAIPKSTGAIPKSTGAIPKSTGAIPKSTGAIPKSSPRSTGTTPKSNSVSKTSTGAISKPYGVSEKSTDAIPKSSSVSQKSTGVISKSFGISEKSSRSIPKSSSVPKKLTDDISKSTIATQESTDAMVISKSSGVVEKSVITSESKSDKRRKKNRKVPSSESGLVLVTAHLINEDPKREDRKTIEKTPVSSKSSVTKESPEPSTDFQ